ncbi:MAG: hypothetical protein JW810_00440, partial [Sedimentisphaerales bacterium]|nr:hypothetical protein [Sedimentisphaerales bacterium]
SRNTDSGQYDDGSEVTQWNSLTTPLILMSAHIARNSRWKFFNTADITNNTDQNLLAVDPDNAVFLGVALDANNEVDVIDEAVGPASFMNVTTAGNGTVLARQAAGSGYVWIAKWDAGTEYYSGAGQTAGGTRYWLTGGTQETAGSVGRGDENYTFEGKKIFLNLVAEFFDYNRPPLVAGGDDVRTTFTSPSTVVSIEGTVLDDGLPLPKDTGDPDEPNRLSWYWTVISKPAGASVGFNPQSGSTFTHANPYQIVATDTDVTIDQAGTYVFALSVSEQLPLNPGTDPCDTVVVVAFPDTKSNLVAYYDFNEGSGSTVTDRSGGIWDPNTATGGFEVYTHDLETATSQAGHDPNWLAGPTDIPMVGDNDFGTALFLDPSYQQNARNDVLNPDDDLLNGFQECTVMMWIKSNEIGVDRGFMVFEDPMGQDKMDMRYDSAGAATGGTNVLKGGFSGAATSNEKETTSGLQTTEWQHAAIVWKKGEDFKWFVNGIENTGAGHDSTHGPISEPLARYQKIIVGAGGNIAGIGAPYWHGLVDEVKIFDKALTGIEIQEAAGIEDGAPEITVMAPDQRVILDQKGSTASLDVTIMDILGDNAVTWSQISGPGTVAFSPDAHTADVTVDFSGQPFGLYQLQLYVEDVDNAAWNDTATMSIMYQAKAQYSTGKDDPMALWKLDAASGTLVEDDTANHLDGVTVKDPNWVAARIDNGLEFINNGNAIESDQIVDLSNVPVMDDMTVMFWMKAKSTSKGKLLDKLPADASGAGFTIYKRDDATRRIQFRVGSDNAQANVNVDGAYEPGTWVHVACSFDSATGTSKVYIDGLLANSATEVTQTLNNIATPLQVGVGSAADKPAQFQGVLDQVRLYDIVLSDFEVAQIAIQDQVEVESCQIDRFPAEQTIVGDVSGPDGVPDCVVDLHDFAAMAGNWLVDTNLGI